MTPIQRKAVEALFCIYGNGGPYHTQGNHEFLRRTLAGEKEPEHFQPTEDCKAAFEKVMAADYSPLSIRVRERLQKEEQDLQHWMQVAGEPEGEKQETR